MFAASYQEKKTLFLLPELLQYYFGVGFYRGSWEVALCDITNGMLSLHSRPKKLKGLFLSLGEANSRPFQKYISSLAPQQTLLKSFSYNVRPLHGSELLPAAQTVSEGSLSPECLRRLGSTVRSPLCARFPRLFFLFPLLCFCFLLSSNSKDSQTLCRADTLLPTDIAAF